MKYFSLIIGILLMVSCNKESDTEANELTQKIKNGNEFFPEYAVGDVKLDTLYLSVIPDDCGEWGGPRDEFKMYVDSVNHYNLEYKGFKFSCDSIDYYRNIRKPVLARRELLLLDAKSKDFLSDFFTEILKAKMQQKVHANAGSWLWLRSRDSTLNIEVYSGKDEIKKNFLMLKNNLGLSSK